MERPNQNAADDIKTKILRDTNIFEVIGQHVQLQDRGHNKVGCCPFHAEKTPSFTVYHDSYFCFGCKEHGDVISFVRKTQGLSFTEALQILGAKLGLDTTSLNFSERSGATGKKGLEPLLRSLVQAQAYFVDNLHKDAGQKALDYLRQRGFPDDFIKKYGFGLALDQPRGLVDHLTKLHRLPISDLVLGSLAAESTRGRGQYFDFFRNRITIPIHDSIGRLIAFGGRTLGDDLPKYKNSRENPLFDKSATLFGFHAARESIRAGKPAILVEGYMDVLQLWRHGLTGAVACMGTALKRQHLRQLAQVTSKIYILFDGDTAGQTATLNATAAAVEFGNLKIVAVTLPKDEDPDTYVIKNTADGLLALMATGEDLLDYAIRAKITGKSGTGIADTIRKELFPWLLSISDPLKRDLILQRLSAQTGISHATLSAELTDPSGQKPKPVASQKPEAAPPTYPPLSRLQEDLVGHLYFAKPSDFQWDSIKTFVEQELDLGAGWLDFLNMMLTILKQNQSPHDPNSPLLQSLSSDTLVKIIGDLQQKSIAYSVPNRRGSFDRLMTVHRLTQKRKQISVLRNRLAGASSADQTDLLRAIGSINAEILSLEKAVTGSAPLL